MNNRLNFLKKFEVRRSRLVATEACRRSKNGKKFLGKVKRDTGLTLELIRPEEEARLAVISCAPLLDPKYSQALIVDIGGGSTELVWIDLAEVPEQLRIAAMLELKLGQYEKSEVPILPNKQKKVKIRQTYSKLIKLTVSYTHLTLPTSDLV